VLLHNDTPAAILKTCLGLGTHSSHAQGNAKPPSHTALELSTASRTLECLQDAHVCAVMIIEFTTPPPPSVHTKTHPPAAAQNKHAQHSPLHHKPKAAAATHSFIPTKPCHCPKSCTPCYNTVFKQPGVCSFLTAASANQPLEANKMQQRLCCTLRLPILQSRLLVQPVSNSYIRQPCLNPTQGT
jgi:hypothetical protein